MDFFKTSNLYHYYIIDQTKEVTEDNFDENLNIVFEDLSITLPSGVVSFIGQNGIGKSTLLLLLAGRIPPIMGKVFIDGIDTMTLIKNENKRNKLVSVVYQNMELDSDLVFGDVLESTINENIIENKKVTLLTELKENMELESILNRKINTLSKGEMQKCVISLCVAYDSKVFMMDEPVFALENKLKEKILNFLYNYSKLNKKVFYFSIHELELTRKFSDMVLMFYKNGSLVLGDTKKALSRESIEKLYEVDLETLYQIERQKIEKLNYINDNS